METIGYEQDKFHWNTLKVHNFLHEQSAHIAQGVDRDGAGDQGIMFGYACRETPELMPAPIQYAQAILRRLAEVRKSGAEPTLGPDAKSQLSLRYEDGKPVEVTSIVLSTQHLLESQTSNDIRAIVEPYNCGDVVRDGIDGFVVPPRDPEALAERIRQIVEDRDLRNWMSRNARERVKEFSSDRYASRLLGALGRLSKCT